MDCIPYINDLQIEINILNDIKKYGNCDLDKICKQIQEKQILIEKCKENLSKLSTNSIEYRIYLKLLNGKTPSEAIKIISDENYYNDVKPSAPSNIWKYYKKLQKIIKQE